ncbi:MAG: stage III sporulation protein AF [Lachnospiraceae bacterium]|nr:stage III sporulation protein AF [Lachnospiraceae bacterium]
MDYFKGIVVFVLLINIIYEFVPNDSYKKYLKHITGVIIILVVIEPICKYCDINHFEDSVNNYFLQSDVIDVNEFMSDANDIALNKSADIYKSNIENEIKSYLMNCNFDISDVETGISITNENEIKIDYVKIDLKFINYEIEDEYIKNMIEEKFFISKEVIEVK